MYCDPLPTHVWNGKFLKSRHDNNKCEWAHTLPTQCFGLGMERLNNTATGVINVEKGDRLTELQCEQACCDDPTCNTYQEYPGRG
jgi:hypothetical protein